MGERKQEGQGTEGTVPHTEGAEGTGAKRLAKQGAPEEHGGALAGSLHPEPN